MNEAVRQTGTSGLDTAKLVAAIVLVLAGIVAYYALTAQPAYVRWLSMVGGVVLAGIVFATSGYGRDLWQFTRDSRVELRKVFWPTRDETLQTTLVVFVAVLVMGIFFWVLDWILGSITAALAGRGG